MGNTGRMNEVVYFYDPMCAWCYGFAPTLAQIVPRLPENVHFRMQLGGLAPDSDEPMSQEMRTKLANNWPRIESMCGVRFNHSYWDQQPNPPRTTYIAGRATVAIRRAGGDEAAFLSSIQKSYYQEARNVWQADVLIDIGRDLGFNISDSLHLPEVREAHEAEIQATQNLGVQGFPTLAVRTSQGWQGLPIAYGDPDGSLEALESVNS